MLYHSTQEIKSIHTCSDKVWALPRPFTLSLRPLTLVTKESQHHYVFASWVLAAHLTYGLFQRAYLWAKELSSRGTFVSATGTIRAVQLMGKHLPSCGWCLQPQGCAKQLCIPFQQCHQLLPFPDHWTTPQTKQVSPDCTQNVRWKCVFCDFPGTIQDWSSLPARNNCERFPE